MKTKAIEELHSLSGSSSGWVWDLKDKVNELIVAFNSLNGGHTHIWKRRSKPKVCRVCGVKKVSSPSKSQGISTLKSLVNVGLVWGNE